MPSVVSMVQCNASWPRGISAMKKRVSKRAGAASGVTQCENGTRHSYAGRTPISASRSAIESCEACSMSRAEASRS